MSNLAEIIITPANVVEAWYAANHKPRTWLGLSECGHKCPRYLWYAHHGYPQKPIEGKKLRLFQLGNLIEDQAAIDLQTAGYFLFDRQKEISITDGSIKLAGHIDGKISGLMESSKVHIWECKTSSDKRFKDLLKSSYEAWDEKYKAQVHVYMLLSKLVRALVWVENKNTNEVYTERIKLDRPYAIGVLERCFAAIKQPSPPDRLCPNASWFEAKWCKYYPICFT